mmetsp:Transcript_105452/g.298453  ORF Transcript_105452/g.298453 Transcript_105452/m.298453 type:complete len:128 (+) Transcript_105452:116-499(+)
MGKDQIDESKVIIEDACCCCYDGCMFEGCPIGCASNFSICCCEGEFCCKTGADCLFPCVCCTLRCAPQCTCIKSEEQCCCCVAAVSFPPDAEVPCMLSLCFLVCYPTFGCCKRFDAIHQKDDAQADS